MKRFSLMWYLHVHFYASVRFAEAETWQEVAEAHTLLSYLEQRIYQKYDT